MISELELGEAALIAVTGDLGENIPCYLFQQTITTSVQVDGEYRRMRIQPQLDTISVESFDGSVGEVDIVKRSGQAAWFKMSRMHMDRLGIEKIVRANLKPA